MTKEEYRQKNLVLHDARGRRIEVGDIVLASSYSSYAPIAGKVSGFTKTDKVLITYPYMMNYDGKVLYGRLCRHSSCLLKTDDKKLLRTENDE